MRPFYVFFFLLSHILLFGQNLPDGFVYLTKLDPSIKKELRYFSKNNFLGRKVDGYRTNKVIITKAAAKQLIRVQEKLKKQGLNLKIYDAYRPQMAVDDFVRWAKNERDTIQKINYYPEIAKKNLFQLDYIALKSGHTRGSTVDLTIVDAKTGEELDMGSPWDFFGSPSHPFYPKLTRQQKANRLLLRTLMLTHGFKPYHKEWWHFTLEKEPFPETYFNFPIE